MRFFRHFQRMWPRFFQTRELRFIQFALEDEGGVFASVYNLSAGEGTALSRRPHLRRRAPPD
jgi:hypothetical protein